MTMTTDTSEILDPVVVADLRRLRVPSMADLFQDLLVMFRGEAPKLLAAMRAAVAENNAEKLKMAAHSLKGAAGSLGATRLEANCAEVEKIGRAGSVEGAEPLLALLDPQFQQVYGALLAEHQRTN